MIDFVTKHHRYKTDLIAGVEFLCRDGVVMGKYQRAVYLEKGKPAVLDFYDSIGELWTHNTGEQVEEIFER